MFVRKSGISIDPSDTDHVAEAIVYQKKSGFDVLTVAKYTSVVACYSYSLCLLTFVGSADQVSQEESALDCQLAHWPVQQQCH